MDEELRDGTMDKEQYIDVVKGEIDLARNDGDKGRLKFYTDKLTKAGVKTDPKSIAISKGLGDKITPDRLKKFENDDPNSSIFLGSLAAKDREAVIAYRENDGPGIKEDDDFNAHLRRGDTPLPIAKRLDALIKTHKVEEPVLTYRGVSGKNAAQLAELPIGSSYTDKGFTSVSSSKREAENFDVPGDEAGVQRFIIPKGGAALPLGGGEKELIVGSGSTWIKTGADEWTLKVRGLKWHYLNDSF